MFSGRNQLDLVALGGPASEGDRGEKIFRIRLPASCRVEKAAKLGLGAVICGGLLE